MSDRIFVPLSSGQWLALEPDAFRAALEAGASVMAPPAISAPDDEPLMDAAALAAVLAVPVTWVEQAARTGRIPSLGVGRYVRFKRSAVEEALAAQAPKT